MQCLPLWPTISENGGTLDKPYGIKLGCEEKAGRTQENALKKKNSIKPFWLFQIESNGIHLSEVTTLT